MKNEKKPSIMKYPYENQDGYKWYIQLYHHTGIAIDPQNCPKFRSQATAKEALKYDYKN